MDNTTTHLTAAELFCHCSQNRGKGTLKTRCYAACTLFDAAIRLHNHDAEGFLLHCKGDGMIMLS